MEGLCDLARGVADGRSLAPEGNKAGCGTHEFRYAGQPVKRALPILTSLGAFLSDSLGEATCRVKRCVTDYGRLCLNRRPNSPYCQEPG